VYFGGASPALQKRNIYLVGRGLPRHFYIKNEREYNKMELCRKIVEELQKKIKSFPEDFYGTFDFTNTGNNLTHPRTIGIICKILWSISTISEVYVDMRFNNGEIKFQPDLTGIDNDGNPLIFVDYESPNSSDARIPVKDIDSYKNWIAVQKTKAPYLIITTLPDRESMDWQTRYTSENGCNYNVREKKSEIQKNPFRFWYSYYREYMKDVNDCNIFFANISGKVVELIGM